MSSKLKLRCAKNTFTQVCYRGTVSSDASICNVIETASLVLSEDYCNSFCFRTTNSILFGVRSLFSNFLYRIRKYSLLAAVPVQCVVQLQKFHIVLRTYFLYNVDQQQNTPPLNLI